MEIKHPNEGWGKNQQLILNIRTEDIRALNELNREFRYKNRKYKIKRELYILTGSYPYDSTEIEDLVNNKKYFRTTQLKHFVKITIR